MAFLTFLKVVFKPGLKRLPTWGKAISSDSLKSLLNKFSSWFTIELSIPQVSALGLEWFAAGLFQQLFQLHPLGHRLDVAIGSGSGSSESLSPSSKELKDSPFESPFEPPVALCGWLATKFQHPMRPISMNQRNSTLQGNKIIKDTLQTKCLDCLHVYIYIYMYTQYTIIQLYNHEIWWMDSILGNPVMFWKAWSQARELCLQVPLRWKPSCTWCRANWLARVTQVTECTNSHQANPVIQNSPRTSLILLAVIQGGFR